MVRWLLIVLLLAPVLAEAQYTMPDSLKGDWMNAGFLRFKSNFPSITKVINVLDYGVKNDNTDSANTSALMSAISEIDTNGITQIYFPAGLYRFSGNINIFYLNDIVLKGDGAQNTRLLFDLNGISGINNIHINHCERIGVQDLYIERMDSSEFGNNISITNSDSCWVSGVESYMPVSNHISFSSSNNIDIYGCYFNSSWNSGPGGNGYGVVIGTNSNNSLIENNIFNHLRHSMITSGNTSGNVFGYNFSTDPYTTEAWFGYNDWPADMCLHGDPGPNNMPPHHTLFEGNIGAFMHADASHGYNGPYNTFFRNRATYYGLWVREGSDKQILLANEVDDKDGDSHALFDNMWDALTVLSFDNIIVGNTNFDPSTPSYPTPSEYVTDQTLYLDTNNMPEFLQQTEYWPPIGVLDNAHLGGGTIPAKQRWGSQTNLTVSIKDFTQNNHTLYSILYQNYPNPFSSKTTISFHLKRSQKIRLSVFDLAGKEVALIAEGEHNAKRHNFTFTTKEIKPGLYFYCLETKNERHLKKMLLH